MSGTAVEVKTSTAVNVGGEAPPQTEAATETTGTPTQTPQAEGVKNETVVEEKLTVTETVTTTGTPTAGGRAARRTQGWWRRMYEGTRNRFRRTRKVVGPTEAPATQATSSEPVKTETKEPAKKEETPTETKKEEKKEEPPKEETAGEKKE